MADTAFATGDALTKKVWSAKVAKEMLRSMYLSKFMGEKANSVIQTKTDLKKEKGDRITIALRMVMTGAGQSSSTTGITLESNEEALVFYDYSVSLSEYGHAVKAQSKLSLQRPAFDLRTEMKDALSDWLADKIEKLLITALLAAPTSDKKIVRVGSGGSNLTTALLSQARRTAQLATPKVRPIKVDGKEWYIVLAHPYATKALKADTDWKNAQLYAASRGSDNNLFTGALGMWDGVIVHEYDRSQMLLSGTKLRTLLLGAQAGCVAWGQMPEWYEKLFDYYRIPGVAVDFLTGIGKTKFNNSDFATVAIDTNYTADTP